MDKILRFFWGIWLFIRYGPGKIVDWQEQSDRDRLTGLYNERNLLEIGNREFAVAKRLEKRGVEYPISVVYADLKEFGKINDSEGHSAGDEALTKVAALFKEICTRKSDTVFRIHGDEFVILLLDTTTAGALSVIDKIQQVATALFSPGGRLIRINFGVAEAKNFNSFKDLLDEADDEMYKNKKGV